MLNTKSLARWIGLVALACTFSAVAGVNTWTMTGPDAGSVHAVAIHPTNSQTALISTTRGLYRTSDGGAHWFLVNEYQYSFATSIAFDPTNPNRVFAVNGALWRSDDAGFSFTKIDDPLNALYYTVAFSSAGTLYVHSIDGQVFRSTNQGNTFSTCALPGGAHGESYAFAVDPNPNASDHLFIEM